MTRYLLPGAGAFLAMIVLAVALVGAASAVTYGAAVVDGDPGEWTDADILAPMYRAGDPTKTIESYAYLRYDCITGTAYVLVKTVDGVTALRQVQDAFVKVNGAKAVGGDSGDNGVPPDFQWVYIPIGGDLRGFEGSFSVPPGAYDLDIHIQVEHDGSQTSALAGRSLGVTFNCAVIPPQPSIDIVKDVSVDGGTTWFAADGTGAAGDLPPEVLECTDVMFRFTVTNIGDVDLYNVVVIDDIYGAVGPIPLPPFTPGSAFDCYLTKQAVAGTTKNIGTVTAEDDQGIKVSDSNPAQYTAYAAAPALTLDKSLDCGEGGTLVAGSILTFKYTVKNTGNVLLPLVTVTDDTLGAIGTITDLAPNAEETLSFETTAGVGSIMNKGTATADYSNCAGSVTATDDDSVTYTGVTPLIAIAKALTCGEGGTHVVGATLTWNYVVSNPSPFTVTGIAVTDDKGVAVSLPKTTLAPGESMVGTGSAAAVEGDYQNTATVTGTATDTCAHSASVSDYDASSYKGIDPTISFTKTVDCASPLTGSTLEFTYTVTNNGPVALPDPVVTDSTGIAVTFDSGDGNSNGVFDVGEAWVFTATDTALAGEHTNTGTVALVYTDDCGGTKDLGTTATATYTAITPAITIDKKTNGYDCGDVNAPKIYKGDPITWTYAVSGANFPVTTVVVVDDKEGTIAGPASGDDGDGILEPGETWTYTKTGTAVKGPYENTATVTGTASDICGNTQGVTDDDTGCYFGWSDDTLTGLGYKESPFNRGKTFATITKGTWFMYLTVTPTSIPDGQSLTFDIQAGTPKNGLVDVGDITITRTGTSYTINRVLDTNVLFAGDPYLYGLYLTDEHLAVDTDRTMSFTGKPGQDDMGYEYPYTFTDSDGYFFVFAHWGAAWGPTLPEV